MGLYLKGIAQLATFTTKDRVNLKILEQANVAINKDGIIENISQGFEIVDTSLYQVIDCQGKTLIPAFIDGHTHPIWAGDRIDEWKAKINGATYEEIHKMGGGIQFTVRNTRNASNEALLSLLLARLNQMSRYGTVTAEVKTGYGLSYDEELRLLRLLNQAAEICKDFINLSITYCGAHSIPLDCTQEEAVKDILERQLPEIKKRIDCNQMKVHNIDVFCDCIAFDAESTEKILKAGNSIGLKANFHSDEIKAIGGTKIVRELNSPSAVSHLEQLDDEGIEALADSGSLAVVLPSTAYLLGLQPPPIEKLRKKSIKLVLGTDFNPNIYILSMPLVMHLAATLYRMTLEECFAAATINAAESLNIQEYAGSIEIGKRADLLIIDSLRWENIIYQFGCAERLIYATIKNGKLVNKQ